MPHSGASMAVSTGVSVPASVEAESLAPLNQKQGALVLGFRTEPTNADAAARTIDQVNGMN